MSRRLDRGAWAIVPALLLGCEATPASLTSPYQGARLSFEPHLAVTLMPVGDGGPSAGEAGPSSPGVSPPGAQGGGGRAAPADAGVRQGRVFGLLDGQTDPTPVAGATVQTLDGRTVTTDENGRFHWPEAWPEDGTWSVRHPGFRASTVVGLPPSHDLTFHLKPHAGFTRPDPHPPEQRFVAGGRVLDGLGQGLEGVLLLLSAPDGSYASPTMTGADGRFEMVIVARGEAVEAATIVALDREQDAWMGAATGLSIASGAAIDFDPTTAGADPLVMRPTTHRLDVEVDDAGTGLPARVFVDLSYPGSNERLLLFGHERSVRLALLPGARFGVEVEAVDSARARQSLYVQPDLALDFTAPHTSYTAKLLPPPTVHPLGRRAALPEITWEPVAGARAYEVRLNSTSRRAEEWEGFTTATSLRFGLPVEALSGSYALQVVAWDDPVLSPRRVASAARPLRLIPPSGAYRRASSEMRLAW